MSVDDIEYFLKTTRKYFGLLIINSSILRRDSSLLV